MGCTSNCCKPSNTEVTVDPVQTRSRRSSLGNLPAGSNAQGLRGVLRSVRPTGCIGYRRLSRRFRYRRADRLPLRTLISKVRMACEG